MIEEYEQNFTENGKPILDFDLFLEDSKYKKSQNVLKFSEDLKS